MGTRTRHQCGEAGDEVERRKQYTGGLTVASSCATCVHWIGRSDAIARRKIYFFLGDLYTRWDVASHTRNYRLDVPSGWKGWPEFE